MSCSTVTVFTSNDWAPKGIEWHGLVRKRGGRSMNRDIRQVYVYSDADVGVQLRESTGGGGGVWGGQFVRESSKTNRVYAGNSQMA